jgi:hypothetical protein
VHCCFHQWREQDGPFAGCHYKTMRNNTDCLTQEANAQCRGKLREPEPCLSSSAHHRQTFLPCSTELLLHFDIHACMQCALLHLASLRCDALPWGAFTLGYLTAVVLEMCCTWWVTGAGGCSSAARAAAGAANRAPDRDRRASWLRGLLWAW